MPKSSWNKNSYDTIWPIAEGLGFRGFLKCISQKVKVMAWFEFELTYFEAAVKLFSYYATMVPPRHKYFQPSIENIFLFALFICL